MAAVRGSTIGGLGWLVPGQHSRCERGPPWAAQYCRWVGFSVVDPYSFFPDPDPDPEFDVGDQYGSGSGFRIRIQGFNDQKFKQNYS